MWVRLGHDAAHLGRVEREVGGPLPLDHGRARDAPDVTVQLVRRLERGDGAAGTGVREQHGLDHLVRPVGGEDLRWVDSVPVGDRGAQRRRRPIGVAVPLDAGQLSRERVAPGGRRRGRRLVGVQPDADVDLRGVVALEGAQVVADRNHRDGGY